MTAARFIEPRAGKAFKRTLALPVKGDQAKVLGLIAAYTDAGTPSPAVRTLTNWLGSGWNDKRVRRACQRLAADGLLVATRRGRSKRPVRYRLPLPDEPTWQDKR